MPYVAVHDPVFVPASKATFARDADLVIGVTKGKVAKAYMALDLMQHGSVDDEMPDGGRESYAGSERNGIRSQAYGKYEGTFTVERVPK